MQHRFALQPASPFSRIPYLVSRIPYLALILSSAVALPITVHAATLCVDKSGAPGCFSTISGAVAASATGDIINVHPGTYHEDVNITSSLSLVGQNRSTTIIDATGLANGIYINGFANPALGLVSLDEIVVSGFTVRNANYEGILANNVSHVTISGNNVLNNDQLASSSCSGLPAFETAETADCGGGIHLIGAVHSSVTQNALQGNAGGVLVSDETTTSHDSVVSNNLIRNNTKASGITLASYPAYFAPNEPHQGGKTFAFGTYDILVTQNLSSGNGSGVAILAPGASSRAWANQVTGNRLIGNVGPGITIHTGPNTTLSGAKNPDASRNTVVNNHIAGNGADVVLPTTVPTGIAIGGGSNVIDTLVTGNVIDDEGIDVAFNSATTLDMHLNDLLGHAAGVANLNPAGLINATEDFWGCAAGPGSNGCSSVIGGVTVNSAPFLKQAVDATDGHCLDPVFDLLQSFFENHGDEDGEHRFGGFGDRF